MTISRPRITPVTERRLRDLFVAEYARRLDEGLPRPMLEELRDLALPYGSVTLGRIAHIRRGLEVTNLVPRLSIAPAERINGRFLARHGASADEVVAELDRLAAARAAAEAAERPAPYATRDAAEAREMVRRQWRATVRDHHGRESRIGLRCKRGGS